MIITGLIRLGADCEVRYTSEGTPVANFSGAWNYGRKDVEGKRPSQWCTFALWGDRAESLSEYLTKGTQVNVVASEVHIETFARRDGGEGFKLAAKVDSIEFAGSRQDRQQGDQQRAPAPAATSRAPAPAPRSAPRTGTGFDDMDDDIPF